VAQNETGLTNRDCLVLVSHNSLLSDLRETNVFCTVSLPVDSVSFLVRSNEMSSVAAHKSHPSCKNFGTKCPTDISLDTSQLSVRTSEANLYENTPSPSSVASTSTIDHSIRDRHRILSSTLKSKALAFFPTDCTDFAYIHQTIIRNC
jgi:hypothetical protein